MTLSIRQYVVDSPANVVSKKIDMSVGVKVTGELKLMVNSRTVELICCFQTVNNYSHHHSGNPHGNNGMRWLSIDCGISGIMLEIIIHLLGAVLPKSSF